MRRRGWCVVFALSEVSEALNLRADRRWQRSGLLRGCMMQPAMTNVRIPKVFLCHAREDADRIHKIASVMKEFQIDPWIDKEKLWPGDRWKIEIGTAIRNTDFFVICLSAKSIRKMGFIYDENVGFTQHEQEGFIRQEINLAVEEFHRRPDGLPFLIPVKLESCEIPPLIIEQRFGGEETLLSEFQWIDLLDGGKSVKRFARGVLAQYSKICDNRNRVSFKTVFQRFWRSILAVMKIDWLARRQAF
jgi:TIR domain